MIVPTAIANHRRSTFELFSTTAAVGDAGSDWPALCVAKEVDVVAFVAGVVDQQLTVAVVAKVEHIHNGSERSEIRLRALKLDHAQSLRFARIYRFNCKFRLDAKPRTHQKDSFVPQRP